MSTGGGPAFTLSFPGAPLRSPGYGPGLYSFLVDFLSALLRFAKVAYE